ncbi:DUF1003 domain-containing protein [Brevibacterium sp. BRM-1]|uniref:DUF1003 domain-containing protein n=1 Tax=Brevibacterium sp. BRM-1 TaxID=2999062 RepID=UPI00227F85AD|nr:DUF1003 domain-containing protein [Brevibacterium sp. BRM-1]WAL40486.1 DUF1003 domain-containing protein [Brevibacterium sp. BRM-1]
MAEKDRKAAGPLDTPRVSKRRLPVMGMPNDFFGTAAEAIARFMGTPVFLAWMTVICALWLGWNTLAPESMQFDPRALNFTLLTLILSLQASYAAPLLLLADNRAADRDRVEFENDRHRDERHLADTEYLMREVSSLRIAMRDMATRDFIRSELKDLLEEMEEARARDPEAAPASGDGPKAAQPKAAQFKTGQAKTPQAQAGQAKGGGSTGDQPQGDRSQSGRPGAAGAPARPAPEH